MWECVLFWHNNNKTVPVYCVQLPSPMKSVLQVSWLNGAVCACAVFPVWYIMHYAMSPCRVLPNLTGKGLLGQSPQGLCRSFGLSILFDVHALAGIFPKGLQGPFDGLFKKNQLKSAKTPLRGLWNDNRNGFSVQYYIDTNKRRSYCGLCPKTPVRLAFGIVFLII